MTSRPLTEAERNLAASVFGPSIDYSQVRIMRRSWWPFQTRNIAMAPNGNIYFHPKGDLWCSDFGGTHVHRQGLFIHEMTHVWQHQKGIWLPLARHPFCRLAAPPLRPGAAGRDRPPRLPAPRGCRRPGRPSGRSISRHFAVRALIL
jgi:hypothetical protein